MRKFSQKSFIIKIAVVAAISLILLVPLQFFRETIKERSEMADNAVEQAGASWGGRQVITGPYLLCRQNNASGEAVIRQSADGRQSTESGPGADIKNTVSVFPDSLYAAVDIRSSFLKKGIYKVPVYRAAVRIDGTLPTMSGEYPGDGRHDMQGRGYGLTFCLGLGDLRGVEEMPEIIVGGRSFKCFNYNCPDNHQEIRAELPSELLEGKAGVKYSVNLKLKGAASLKFIPAGDNTQIKMVSDYPDPSFTGSYIPAERKVGRNGFSALWKVNALNRQFQKVTEGGDVYAVAGDSSFGVDMYVPVSQYKKIERSVKYALLVILLTMAALMLVEAGAGIYVNYLQYFLTGADLAVFYSLLLSFSEHLVFGMAFLIAAFMTIGLMVIYMKSVLGGWARSLGLGAFTSLIYAYIYILLGMGDFAFLTGSVGLFVILAMVMFFSQRTIKRLSSRGAEGKP